MLDPTAHGHTVAEDLAVTPKGGIVMIGFVSIKVSDPSVFASIYGREGLDPLFSALV